MDERIRRIKDIYHNFLISLGVLRKKQSDLLGGVIKKREESELLKIREEFKKYE